MTQKQFAQVRRGSSEIAGFFLQPFPPNDTDDHIYVEINPPFSDVDNPQPTSTSILYRHQNKAEWRDPVTIELKRLRAIEEIDIAGENARMIVITQQTQTEEYKRALEHARQYEAAGFTGPVPRGVAGWTKAMWRAGWTDRQAAEDILMTAALWFDLLDDIRDARLLAKQDILHTDIGEAIEARVLEYKAQLVGFLKTVVGQ